MKGRVKESQSGCSYRFGGTWNHYPFTCSEASSASLCHIQDNIPGLNVSHYSQNIILNLSDLTFKSGEYVLTVGMFSGASPLSECRSHYQLKIHIASKTKPTNSDLFWTKSCKNFERIPRMSAAKMLCIFEGLV